MTTEQDVIATHQAFYAAFEKMDVEAMGLIWSKHPSTSCIHPGRNSLEGWEQIRFSWDQIFRNTNQIEVAADVLSTYIKGDLAYMILVENLVQVVPERRMEVQGMVTNIFEYDGSNWYLLHRHASPLVR